jgi:signal transduction histidine kinase
MATTRGVPAEPARRQPEDGSTSARDRSTPIGLAEVPEPTSEQLRNQVIALQRISSLGVLAGGVFHELNNALTPILNYAKLGLRNPDPAYRERALKQIIESAERATTISRGMLGLARLGTGPAQREPADLSQLVKEVVLLVNKDLAKHRVRLEVKVSGNPRARVEPAQIQQVLINLLINARQAMPQGGVVRLRAGTAATGRRVEISVSDNGVGIAPEDLRRIFEPFYSTKSAPDSAGQGGTGLGLAVCRDIIEAHHGRIRAESRPGQGSTFTIILPACVETTAPAAHVARDGAA